MSPVSLALDLLLAALLVSALVVGLRLNRQLKQLRAGQAGFVRAVAELDAAATRADSGLKALRAASEDTHDQLLARIETARGLIGKLDAATVAAARAVEALPPAPARAVPRPPTARTPLAPSPPGAQALARAAPAAAVDAAPSRAAARLDPRFRSPVRPAARELDADLFEAEPEAAPDIRRRGLGR